MLISSIEDEEGKVWTVEHGAAKTTLFTSPKRIHPPNFFISSLTALKEFYLTQDKVPTYSISGLSFSRSA